MRNPTDIKAANIISKTTLRGPPHKRYCPIKINYRNDLQPKAYSDSLATTIVALTYSNDPPHQSIPTCTQLTQEWAHTLNIAFRHLPPNSARFGYATEGALFISAQLSTDAIGALRKVWVWKQLSAQART